MSTPILAWTLSALGALLFFAAGMLFAVRKTFGSATHDAQGGLVRVAQGLPESAPSLRARRSAAALVENLRGAGEPDAAARPGSVLRAILDEETRGGDFTGAVIADELGLVVASTGEYGDALAAYGAFLAGIGVKASDALPLQDIRHVIVQDEHDMTLTVRPIAAADDNFALVTLATRHHERPRVSTAPGR